VTTFARHQEKSMEKAEISTDESLWAQKLNKVLFCKQANGRSFSAKLVAVDGENLYFQNSRGNIIRNKLASLTFISIDQRSRSADHGN